MYPSLFIVWLIEISSPEWNYSLWYFVVYLVWCEERTDWGTHNDFSERNKTSWIHPNQCSGYDLGSLLCKSSWFTQSIHSNRNISYWRRESTCYHQVGSSDSFWFVPTLHGFWKSDSKGFDGLLSYLCEWHFWDSSSFYHISIRTQLCTNMLPYVRWT